LLFQFITMFFNKITESDSNYNHIEDMSVNELLTHINNEDQTVAKSVQKIIPEIEKTVHAIVEQLNKGGRLFYIGAGTSGRIGVLDASECPPTFGVPYDLVIALIAGGDTAIRKAVENAEDNKVQAAEDLKAHHINSNDFLIGIAASGTTPYVLGAVDYCKNNHIPTAGITCNPGSPLATNVDFPMVAVVGPEFVTGSSRMKAGTAQKLILNMISTSVMIRMGRVKGNKMVDMKLSNDKLIDRAERMLMEELNIDNKQAKTLIEKHGNVRNALLNYNK